MMELAMLRIDRDNYKSLIKSKLNITIKNNLLLEWT